MERAHKTRFSEHQRKSNVGSEVSQHVHVDRPENGVSLDKVKLLKVDNRKFESIYASVYMFLNSCPPILY